VMRPLPPSKRKAVVSPNDCLVMFSWFFIVVILSFWIDCVNDLFLCCYHSVYSDKNGHDGKGEDDFYLVHIITRKRG